MLEESDEISFFTKEVHKFDDSESGAAKKQNVMTNISAATIEKLYVPTESLLLPLFEKM